MALYYTANHTTGFLLKSRYIIHVIRPLITVLAAVGSIARLTGRSYKITNAVVNRMNWLKCNTVERLYNEKLPRQNEELNWPEQYEQQRYYVPTKQIPSANRPRW